MPTAAPLLASPWAAQFQPSFASKEENATSFGALRPVAASDKPAEPVEKQPVDQESERLKAISDRNTRAFENFTSNMPKFPAMTPSPPPPKPEETDPVSAWGSLAMLAAALGGLRSRTHATTAVNAAAEALKGFHQRDQEQYQHAMDKWKIESENAARIQNYELDAYRAVMQQKEFDLNKIMQMSNMDRQNMMVELRALAIGLQDQRAQKQLEERRIEDFIKDRIALDKLRDAEEKQRKQVIGFNTMSTSYTKEYYSGGIPKPHKDKDGNALPIPTFEDYYRQNDPETAAQLFHDKPQDPASETPAEPQSQGRGVMDVVKGWFGGGATAQPRVPTDQVMGTDGVMHYSYDNKRSWTTTPPGQ
jgi:hypothetical protein